MPCYKPLHAYRSCDKTTKNGKSSIHFKRQDAGKLAVPVVLPCGQCIGCRIDRSREWALRCVHEASLYENNCFLTLTFNDENLNVDRTLVKSDFQKFMKRLRKRFYGCQSVVNESGKVTYPIRYFHCGEYGSDLERPHHHCCLFNFRFPDEYLWSVRSGVSLYRSEELESLWPFGFCTIGEVTWQSAAYVARYVTKKVNGDYAAVHYARVDDETGEMYYVEPEYVTMSRRPGIGKRWFDKYKDDVYPKDFITNRGKKLKTPRYYDRIFDCSNPHDLVKIKKRRLKNAKKYAKDNTDKRLSQRAKVLAEKSKRLVRSYEECD